MNLTGQLGFAATMTMGDRRNPKSDSSSFHRGGNVHRELYWLVSGLVSVITIRLFIGILMKLQLVTADEGGGLFLVALPVSLLTIAWMAPRDRL